MLQYKIDTCPVYLFRIQTNDNRSFEFLGIAMSDNRYIMNDDYCNYISAYKRDPRFPVLYPNMYVKTFNSGMFETIDNLLKNNVQFRLSIVEAVKGDEGYDYFYKEDKFICSSLAYNFYDKCNITSLHGGCIRKEKDKDGNEFYMFIIWFDKVNEQLSCHNYTSHVYEGSDIYKPEIEKLFLEEFDSINVAVSTNIVKKIENIEEISPEEITPVDITPPNIVDEMMLL